VTSNTTINDCRIDELRPLITPRVLCGELPLSHRMQNTVLTGRQAVAAILEGSDDRLLLIAGPCSVHDPAAALDYATRLAALASRFESDLFVVMRVYFEKPRTTLGWKGLINDPDLDGSFRVNEGLGAARALLRVVLALDLPVGCEFLDPITPQYIADAVSWGAIGARTSQSQIHRQLASGLSMPVGFKNSTEGDVQGAVDSIAAAASAQVFPSVTQDGQVAIVSTCGNSECHLVLRGGAAGPNYDEKGVHDAQSRLARAGVPMRLVVDASHGNSGKDHRRQSLVVAEIASRLAAGDDAVAGLMLESFLLPGRQDITLGRADELTYGQSITDPCIGWAETAELVETLAEAVTRRRQRRRVTAGLPPILERVASVP